MEAEPFIGIQDPTAQVRQVRQLGVSLLALDFRLNLRRTLPNTVLSTAQDVSLIARLPQCHPAVVRRPLRLGPFDLADGPFDHVDALVNIQAGKLAWDRRRRRLGLLRGHGFPGTPWPPSTPTQPA